jgi:hypothetical protein
MMDAAALGNGEQSYDVRLDAETVTLEHFSWPVLIARQRSSASNLVPATRGLVWVIRNRGDARQKSIDVRFAPKATVSHQNVICRNGPIADISVNSI